MNQIGEIASLRMGESGFGYCGSRLARWGIDTPNRRDDVDIRFEHVRIVGMRTIRQVKAQVLFSRVGSAILFNRVGSAINIIAE